MSSAKIHYSSRVVPPIPSSARQDLHKHDPSHRSRGNKFSSALAWLALVLGLGCVTGPETRSPREAPRLRIGVESGRPPLAEIGREGWYGLEIELGRRAAKSQGLEAEFVDVSSHGPFEALGDERVDVITATLSNGASPRTGFLFSRPYLQLGLRVAIRAASLAEFEDPLALESAGARVGYVTRTPGGAFVRDQLPLSDAYAFRDPDAAIRSLRSHRIDFFIHDGAKIRAQADRYEPSGVLILPRALGHENYAWAVRARDKSLLARLNTFLDRAMASRRLEAVYETWFPEPPQPTE